MVPLRFQETRIALLRGLPTLLPAGLLLFLPPSPPPLFVVVIAFLVLALVVILLSLLFILLLLALVLSLGAQRSASLGALKGGAGWDVPG
jgi:hypothetical protein